MKERIIVGGFATIWIGLICLAALLKPSMLQIVIIAGGITYAGIFAYLTNIKL